MNSEVLKSDPSVFRIVFEDFPTQVPPRGGTTARDPPCPWPLGTGPCLLRKQGMKHVREDWLKYSNGINSGFKNHWEEKG